MKLNEQIKTVQIIFFALLTGQLIFLFISVYLVQSGNIKLNEDLFLILLMIDLMIVFPAIVLGPMLYRSFLNKAKSGLSLTEKFNIYRQAVIVKLALVEAPTIFSIVSYLLTGSFVFLIIAIGVLILFFFHKPSIEKFVEDFNVPFSELE
ncbi:Hypothetical protein IALB_0409 [Ignavibacterium album JCM 16511]|uniref:Uncharacterized protein n=1 Tax=Ignavibacterium album (strain DSM 19864 / JCM 16511 / NBRC 101810 / Mat9-16) TaxID=945713 RepID=I0AGL4_IGNAJ|nr:hypothetical protein [Ignavibacterium album]AFH48121.1 Hypothetical protein IALB_0409 [Ignavibacterium album JCM 16511]